MSISSEVVRALYAGNGSTTTFAIPHEIVEDSSDETEVYLVVTDTKVETLQTEGSDYTISGSDVVFSVAPASTKTVVVQRKITLTQPSDLSANAGFPAEEVETTLDRLTAEIQLINHKLKRAPLYRLSVANARLNPTLPDPSAAAYLRWKADLSGLENVSAEVPEGSITLPGSSTDRALALWNGTGANALQDSTAILGAAGELLGVPSVHVDFKAKTADYTLTAAEHAAQGNATGGAFAFTLPTAVGIAGKKYQLFKVDVSTNAISIATTSAQTVGGRASSDVKLRQLGDFVEVVSDGANWQILNKKETQFIISANTESFSNIGTAGNYGLLGVTAALTYGVWKLKGQFNLRTGTGVAPGFLSGSGFRAADGANSASAPTVLANVIAGAALWTDAWASAPVIFNNTASATDNSQLPSTVIDVVLAVTSSYPVYLVPRIDYSTVGTASVTAQLVAERVW